MTVRLISADDFRAAIKQAAEATSVEAVAEAAGVGVPTVRRWVDGVFSPHPMVRSQILAAAEAAR